MVKVGNGVIEYLDVGVAIEVSLEKAPSAIMHRIVVDRPVRSVKVDGPLQGLIDAIGGGLAVLKMNVDILNGQVADLAVIARQGTDTRAEGYVSKTVAVRGILDDTVGAAVHCQKAPAAQDDGCRVS